MERVKKAPALDFARLSGYPEGSAGAWALEIEYKQARRGDVEAMKLWIDRAGLVGTINRADVVVLEADPGHEKFAAALLRNAQAGHRGAVRCIQRGVKRGFFSGASAGFLTRVRKVAGEK